MTSNCHYGNRELLPMLILVTTETSFSILETWLKAGGGGNKQSHVKLHTAPSVTSKGMKRTVCSRILSQHPVYESNKIGQIVECKNGQVSKKTG